MAFEYQALRTAGIVNLPKAGHLPTRRRGYARFCGLVLAAITLGMSPVRAQEAATPEAVADVAQKVAESAAAQAGQTAPPQSVADNIVAQQADPRRFTFNFANQPWKAVLEWYARESGLSLNMDQTPPGTFNFTDSRRYTATEALDVINRVLYTKGWLLVKHDNLLVPIDTDANEVPPHLIPDVSLDELDKRGEFELVRVIFPVWNMTADDAGKQVQLLLGPKMKVVTLPQSRQIQVTELVHKQKMIRSVIDAGNQPGPGGFRPYVLKYISVDSAMPTIRQALGIAGGADVTPDGTPTSPPSARIVRSALPNTLLFQGNADGAARLEQILRLIDVPANGVELARQTQSYALNAVDPKKAMDVLNKMFEGNPNVALVDDPGAGTLTAVAPPSAQASIRATIDMLQKDARQIEVIPLTRLDPVSAKSILTSAFGGGGTPEAPNPNAVSVEYDANQRVLVVRGTKAQIEQVHKVLEQLGENSQSDASSIATSDRIRILPYTQAAALTALNQIRRIVPSMGDRIQLVSPPRGIPVRRPNGPLDPSLLGPQNAPTGAGGRSSEPTPGIFERYEGRGRAPAKDTAIPTDRETQSAEGTPFRFVAQEVATPERAQPNAVEATPAPTAPKTAAAPSKGAPVMVVPGPNGLVVVSDDLKALDELERLLTLVAPTTTSTERELGVYYLQYASAETAAGILSSFYGGNTAGARGGRGGRGGGGGIADIMTQQIVQQLAGSAGNALGDLLGGAGFSSAGVDIVPLIDKNAVLVRAKPADLATIEQILEVVDQRSGPIEDESDPEPRRIQVYNVAASEMQTMIQTLYADRIATPGGLSNQDFTRLLTGGGGGGAEQEQKMTIYADTKNNQLLVRAPGPLFDKVASLVAELDQVSFDTPGDVTSVRAISSASMAAMRAALEPLSSTGQNASNSGNNNNNQNNLQQQQLQQFLQMQNALGNRGGRGGGGNQGGGRGGRGGRGGGGGGNAGGGGGGLGALQGILGGGGGGGGGRGGRGGGGGGRGG
jgi:type II secretory pathway component GspD/PulD (secretin)